MSAYPEELFRNDDSSLNKDYSNYDISFSVPDFPRVQGEQQRNSNGEERDRGEGKDEEEIKISEPNEHPSNRANDKENNPTDAWIGASKKFGFAQVVRETMLKEKGVSRNQVIPIL